MTRYETVKKDLINHPKIWLITGVAGFIGSNLLETLLKLDQTVIGLDNFSNGFKHNLDEVKSLVSKDQWQRFEFVEGDIRDIDMCKRVMHHQQGPVDYVLHQAALGSVPRSINDPITSNSANVTGFLNMLVAAKEANHVQSFTYAASSSTYGDHPALPKVEENIGKPLSPYAVTKYVNELYAEVFARTYDFNTIGLRYFNVFGPRQTPEGAYAAVIPKWTGAMIRDQDVFINGDGETSRDFSYVANAVQLNILAATAPDEAKNQVYNMALGDRTTLNMLFESIKENLALNGVSYEKSPIYRDFRPGDVRHSQADTSKARQHLGYAPTHKILDGIKAAMPWYVKNLEH